jgi:hypothetical protein
LSTCRNVYHLSILCSLPQDWCFCRVFGILFLSDPICDQLGAYGLAFVGVFVCDGADASYALLSKTGSKA